MSDQSDCGLNSAWNEIWNIFLFFLRLVYSLDGTHLYFAFAQLVGYFLLSIFSAHVTVDWAIVHKEGASLAHVNMLKCSFLCS